MDEAAILESPVAPGTPVGALLDEHFMLLGALSCGNWSESTHERIVRSYESLLAQALLATADAPAIEGLTEFIGTHVALAELDPAQGVLPAHCAQAQAGALAATSRLAAAMR